MIRYSCPACGKKHVARDDKAGRNGLCACGKVIAVPGIQNAGGDAAHDADDRLCRRIAVGGGFVGIVIIAAVVYTLFFHNAWERDNRARLLFLKADADALVQASDYEKAEAKFDELFRLLGQNILADEYLKGEIEAARISQAQTSKKLAPIRSDHPEEEARQKQRNVVHDVTTIVEAFYDPKRSPPYRANAKSFHASRSLAIQALAEQFDRTPTWIEQTMGDSNDCAVIHRNIVDALLREITTALATASPTRNGSIDFGVVDRVRRAWQNAGLRFASRDERNVAMFIMIGKVEDAVSDPADRKATLDHIESHIGSW